MPGALASRRRALPVARPATALAGAAVLVAALTGASCGDDGPAATSPSSPDAGSASPSVAASPGATAAAGGEGADGSGVTAAAADLAPGDTVDAMAVLEPVAAAVAAAGTAQGLLESETPEGRLAADVQYDFGVPGARIVADVSGGELTAGLGDAAVEVEGLLLPDAVYLRFDAPGGGAEAATGWVRIAADGSEAGANPFAGIEDRLDATRIVESLEPGAVLTYEGTETVGGTQADHWSLDLDPAEAEGLDRVDYWITAEELPARFTTQLADSEGGERGEVRVEYEQWGEPVDLAPPPDSDVTDLSGVPIP